MGDIFADEDVLTGPRRTGDTESALFDTESSLELVALDQVFEDLLSPLRG